MLRPGRIDSILTVGAPTLADCRDILRVHSSRLPLLAPAPTATATATPTPTSVGVGHTNNAAGAGGGGERGDEEAAASSSATFVDLDVLAARCVRAGATGADLRRLCQEAALVALREDVENAAHITRAHFDAAFRNIFLAS